MILTLNVLELNTDGVAHTNISEMIGRAQVCDINFPLSALMVKFIKFFKKNFLNQKLINLMNKLS